MTLDELLAGHEQPKTWGELTDQVLAIIDAEPLRLCMRSYFLDTDDAELQSHAGRPDCGTVGCFLGWGSVVLHKAVAPTGLSDKLTARIPTYSGTTYYFRVFAAPLFDACYLHPTSKSGTREYADEALSVFRAIRGLYREEMDNTPVDLEES